MEIRLSKKFTKHYDKCPRQIRQVFDERLAFFIKDPVHSLLNNHALQGKLKGFQSINVTGDWRALYSKYEDEYGEMIIVFELIGTHSQLYR